MPLVGRIVFLHVHVQEIGIILPQVRDHVDSVEDVQAAPTQVAAQYYLSQVLTASRSILPLREYNTKPVLCSLPVQKPI